MARNVGFAVLSLTQTEETPGLELRIGATDDGYVTEDGLGAMCPDCLSGVECQNEVGIYGFRPGASTGLL